MLALVSAERDTEERVLAILDRPLSDVVSYVEAVLSIEIVLSIRGVRIRRVEQYRGESVLERDAGAADPRPVARADPRAR